MNLAINVRERRAVLPSPMHFLHKPFTPRTLIAASRGVLDEWKPAEETRRHALSGSSSRG